MAGLNSQASSLDPRAITDSAIGADHHRVQPRPGSHGPFDVSVADVKRIKQGSIGANVPARLGHIDMPGWVQPTYAVIGVARIEAVGAEVIAFKVNGTQGGH